MPSSDSNTAYNGYSAPWPKFYIGQHDSTRYDVLTRDQYEGVLDLGFSFATAPITNKHFHERVVQICQNHRKSKEAGASFSDQRVNPSVPFPTVPTLTDDDTSLFPGVYTPAMVAFCSPWIDLYADDGLVANLSRQVLNMEVAYASFCGVRSIVVPGPRADDQSKNVAQYARAIQEALQVANRASIVVHLPMYREPGLDETAPLLPSDPATATASASTDKAPAAIAKEIDIYSAWDTWHAVRSLCNYNANLSVAIRIPWRLPEMELQTRWFAEPVHFLTLSATVFQMNRAGFPTLSKLHQDMIFRTMRQKNSPWIILADAGPDAEILAAVSSNPGGDSSSESSPTSPLADSQEFPTLAEAHSSSLPELGRQSSKGVAHLKYLKHLEEEQDPFSVLESSTLTSFQDWLQSPLQPLADNLESVTYEVFEGDPVKYAQYEKAITAAMNDWKALKKPTSAVGPTAQEGDTAAPATLVVAVAGAGRGPLVTRVLRASVATGVPVQLWALEKNQNAYVYLLRMNKQVWGGKVTVIKTDMRAWQGPVTVAADGSQTTTAVDILVTELLGSFGDNELSPECIDGIQKHLAVPYGISIPQSYSAHISPISYPRIHAELCSRSTSDENAFQTPWVVYFYSVDYVSQKVPGHPRFQQTWEFVHPVRLPFAEEWEAQHGAAKIQTGGGGAMHQSAGTNEHNARHCHLKFVCRPRGVIHGLAGFFESVLYQPEAATDGTTPEPIEISIRPDQIDRKSKDMISWFPIFFPLKKPLYFPQDSEIEVSMWRQTDDSRVWYEWSVEVYVWLGPNTRAKVAASELHSSRKVACLMQ